MQPKEYWLKKVEGHSGIWLRFYCPGCLDLQPSTRGWAGNYCCPSCGTHIQYEAPAELKRAMDFINLQPEQEEELAGEDAEELIILEMPGILQTMAMAAGERKADYRPFSPSWGVFELLATVLQLAVGTATEAASIVAAERDHNVD